MPFAAAKSSSSIYLGTRKGVLGRAGRKVEAKYEDRKTHMYVIGITGKGKSKHLENVLFQDIKEGRGCGALDPHSDFADDTLRRLLRSPGVLNRNKRRIIYFEPSRRDFLIPFNILDSEFSPHETAVNIVESFKRTWPEELKAAPRFTDVAMNAILVLIYNKLSLIELDLVLTSKTYRDELLENVEDKAVIKFFKTRYERWGKDTHMMIESLLNKVSALTSSPDLRVLLGANTNGLKFKEIMDRKKILILDLGRVDATARKLIGSLIVTGLEQAARSRQDVSSELRVPFYFIMDEFQDYASNDGATGTLASIISECRKYGFYLTLAHQDLAQLTPRMVGALSNIQLMNIFGSGRDSAEILAKTIYKVNPTSIKHTIKDKEKVNSTHPIFDPVPEQWEAYTNRLMSLDKRHFIAKFPDGRVEELKTLTAPSNSVTEDDLDLLKTGLVQRVGKSRSVLEDIYECRQDLALRFLAEEGTGSNKPKKQDRRGNDSGDSKSRRRDTSKFYL